MPELSLLEEDAIWDLWDLILFDVEYERVATYRQQLNMDESRFTKMGGGGAK